MVVDYEKLDKQEVIDKYNERIKYLFDKRNSINNEITDLRQKIQLLSMERYIDNIE